MNCSKSKNSAKPEQKLPLLPKNHAKKRQEHQRGQGADITRNLEQIEF